MVKITDLPISLEVELVYDLLIFVTMASARVDTAIIYLHLLKFCRY